MTLRKLLESPPLLNANPIAFADVSSSVVEVSTAPIVAPTIDPTQAVSIVNPGIGEIVSPGSEGLTLDAVTSLVNDALLPYATISYVLDQVALLQAQITDLATDFTLDELIDVTITTPTSGQYLKWNGSAWVNATIDYSEVTGTPGSGTFVDLVSTQTIDGAKTFIDPVTINANALSLASTSSGVVLHLGQVDGTVTRFWLDSFGAATNYTARRANGTNASKTALLSGDVVMNNSIFGYDGTAYTTSSRGSMQIAASQNWAVGAHGTKITFATTTDNTTTQTNRWVIENDGSLIYSGGSVTGNGTINAIDYFDNGVNISSIYLAASSYTAADVLSKLLTVDGAGSGIDADLFDGNNSTAFPLLASANTFTANQTVLTTSAISQLTLGGSVAFGAYLSLRGNAGQQRRIQFQTGSTHRWILYADDAAEAGSNAGTDLRLLAYDDAGTSIGNVWTVTRATRVVNYAVNPTSNGNTIWNAGNDGAGSGLDADLLDGKNTGTSGNVIGLLDGNNTYSGTSTFTNTVNATHTTNGAPNIRWGSLDGVSSDASANAVFSRNAYYDGTAAAYKIYATSSGGWGMINVGGNTIQFSGASGSVTAGTTITPTWNTIWHAGNDGSGSGLDADLVRGTTPGSFGLTLLDDTTQGAAQTTLGLVIGTNVQAYNAALASIAGLTTAADRGIYTTASNTYAVYTFTSFARTLLDDADASAARTTLGLGTSATVNTGTSGATIPLLNGANTWGSTAVFSAGVTFSSTAVFNNVPTINSANPIFQFYESDGGTDAKYWEHNVSAGQFNFRLINDAYSVANSIFTVTRTAHTAATFNFGSVVTLQANGNTIWHAGNDGPGSTLDSDTVDGYQATNLLARANHTGTQAWSTLTGTPTTLAGYGITDAVSGTGSYTAADVLSKLLTVDGAGSGLDADLWDGNNFATYLNQALLTSSNATFATVTTSGTYPRYDWYDTDGAADAKRWQYAADGGSLFLYAVNDAYSASSSVLQIQRISGYNGGSHVYWNDIQTFNITSSAAFYPQLILTNSNDDASAPYIIMQKTSASYALNDTIGNLMFRAKGTDGNYANAAYLTASYISRGVSFVETQLDLLTTNSAGTLASALTVRSSGALYTSGNSSLIWHAGNDGSGSGLDADLLDGNNIGTSGAAVPLLNGVNTWSGKQTFSATGAAVVISSAEPRQDFYQTDAGADAKLWSFIGDGNNFYLQTRTDADVFGVNAFQLVRSGTTISTIAFTSTAFTWNGNTVWSSGNDGSGSGLDADLLDGNNIGTSGAAVPLLNGTNTWSGAQTVSVNASTQLTIQRTDEGASGAQIDAVHSTTTQAANDSPFTLRVIGRDSTNTATVYGRLRFFVTNATDTTEAGYWQIAPTTAGAETAGLAVTGTTMTFNSSTVWHAGNDGSGSGLDADLLDGNNIGTSGAAVPLLNGVNTWSGNQTISTAATGALLSLISSEAGATAFTFDLHRNSASPAASDGIAAMRFRGQNASASTVTYSSIQSNISDTTAASEDAVLYLQTMMGGALTNALSLGASTIEHVFTTPTDSIVSSQGTSGYGAFFARGSGTNSAYVFFGNVTNAERARIYADNSRNFVISTNSGSTNHLLISSTGQVNLANGPLQIGTVANPRLYMYNSAGTASTLTIGADSAAGWIGTFTSAQFSIYANSTERLRVPTSGSLLRDGTHTIWDASNDGAGSGLDADTLDGYQAANLMILANQAQRLSTTSGIDVSAGTAPAGSTNSALEIFQATAGTDAYFTFHIGSDYAVHFGLDGGTNDLFVGGWSMGTSTTHKIWHAGNDGSGSGLDADTLDSLNSTQFLRSDLAQQGGFSYATHDFNTYPSVYSVSFVNPTGSSNLPTSMTSVMSYRFVMAGGDTTSRGVDLVAAAEGSGNLYFRERSIGTWSRFWHQNNDGSGSGLDADLLDGYNVGTSGGAIPLLNGTNTWSGTQTMSALTARVTLTTAVSGTLTSAHANISVELNGNVTLNNSVFTAGDKTVFDPGTSNRTFTRGAGVTMYVNGTDSATATLAANQIGGMHWRSASVVILTGAFT